MGHHCRSDGSVYVADTMNDRIQRMIEGDIAETLFETTLPINQPAIRYTGLYNLHWNIEYYRQTLSSGDTQEQPGTDHCPVQLSFLHHRGEYGSFI